MYLYCAKRIGHGLASIFVTFRCTNLQNKIFLHKPTILKCAESETPQFFYRFNVKDASKYANYTV